jgi:catechol 2,3-dioxygenase-like lactoylglutathione lyase family enzyme
MRGTALIATVAAVMIAPAGSAQQAERPHVYGIAGTRFYVTDVKTAREFYLAATDTKRACDWCETEEPSAFRLPSGQFLLLTKMTVKQGVSRLAEVSFDADHLKELAQLFKANNIRYEITRADRAITMIRATDPGGNLVCFLDKDTPRQYKAYYPNAQPDAKLTERMLHVGFVVRDREVMDHFYKDILGFHVYWQGGIKDGETDWVDMQVPDGTDWVEYMLNAGADTDEKTLGMMNHVALGVQDVHAAYRGLLDVRAGLRVGEEPKIGRDGKWQLNLYDPDRTRVELMEFTPVRKPCCGEYTGPHPSQ